MSKQVVVRQYIERPPRKKSPYTMGRFMMLSQAGVAELTARLADRSIKMQAVRVLVAMMERAQFRNRIDETHKELACRLEMSQHEVSRAALALAEYGFIERVGNRRGLYRISPRLAWKGDVETLEAELDRRAA